VNSFDLFLFFQKIKRIDSIYPVFSKKMKQNVSFEKFPKKISKKNFDRRGLGLGGGVGHGAFDGNISNEP
jgi:hypothetical protein